MRGLSIVVRDRGPGVPASDLERIFEPFYRVAESRDRDTGGEGIGLAITSQVMKAHGGSAKADNRVGGGFEVRLSLPRAALTDEQESRGEPVSRGLQVHSGRRQFAGARISQRRRRAHFLQEGRRGSHGGRGWAAVHRLRRFVGPDDPGACAPGGDRSGTAGGGRRLELRRAHRARNRSSPGASSSSCPPSSWCASSARARRRP